MVVAGIVVDGVGSRMGQNILPKQFLELAGKPIVIHTVEKFLASLDIDRGAGSGQHPHGAEERTYPD
ncbi:MAG: 2-C-methyl-D-erythritol 4-phosphate cytidylyltransferase [Acetatifactor sp.]|nr:2-C-methyl-D-erythritol 4-phosphate cytidylyltransferase [Acetatifactor sp.]